MIPLAAPDSLFARLRGACGGSWAAYVEHAFVRQLAAGTLAEACFRRYLVQDYLFLIHLARAYALAAYKAEDLADMRGATAGAAAILDTEISLHLAFCDRWGLSEHQIVAVPEAPQTMAYTRYVLEAGLRGDVLDLYVALAPCVAGYAEIGTRLAADPATVRAGNPYDEWIAMYVGDAYQQVARDHVAQLDGLWRSRAGGARWDALARIFDQATRLEADFWQMGLDEAAGEHLVP